MRSSIGKPLDKGLKPSLTICTPNIESESDPEITQAEGDGGEEETSSVSTWKTPLTGKGSAVHTPATCKSSMSLHFDRLYPDIIETEENIEYALTQEYDPNSMSHIHFVDNLNHKERVGDSNLDASHQSTMSMQDIYQDARSPMYSGNALFFLEASRLSTNLTLSSHSPMKNSCEDPSDTSKDHPHPSSPSEEGDDKDVSTMSPASHTLLLSEDISFAWDDEDSENTFILNAPIETSSRPKVEVLSKKAERRFEGYIDGLSNILMEQLQPSFHRNSSNVKLRQHLLDVTACSSQADRWMEKIFPEDVIRCLLPFKSPLLAEICVIMPRSVLTVMLMLLRVTEVSVLSGIRWYLYLCLWPFRTAENALWRVYQLLVRQWYGNMSKRKQK